MGTGARVTNQEEDMSVSAELIWETWKRGFACFYICCMNLHRWYPLARQRALETGKQAVADLTDNIQLLQEYINALKEQQVDNTMVLHVT